MVFVSNLIKYNKVYALFRAYGLRSILIRDCFLFLSSLCLFLDATFHSTFDLLVFFLFFLVSKEKFDLICTHLLSWIWWNFLSSSGSYSFFHSMKTHTTAIKKKEKVMKKMKFLKANLIIVQQNNDNKNKIKMLLCVYDLENVFYHTSHDIY